MKKNLAKIREYTNKNAILSTSHHFLYDLPVISSKGSQNIIIMGFNPGETNDDWVSTNGKRTEETSDYDFLEENGRRTSNRWFQRVKAICGDRNVTQTELFFWSTPNVETLHERIQDFYSSPELEFCTSMNRDLFEYYQPQLIIFTGISYANTVAKIYDLRKSDEFFNGGKRLFIRYNDRQGRPWLVVKHLTGSFGFKKTDMELLRLEVDRIID